MTDKLTNILHRMVTTDSVGEANAALNLFRKIAGEEILNLKLSQSAPDTINVAPIDRHSMMRKTKAEIVDDLQSLRDLLYRANARCTDMSKRHDDDIKELYEIIDFWREKFDEAKAELDALRLRPRPLVFTAHSIITNHAA